MKVFAARCLGAILGLLVLVTSASGVISFGDGTALRLWTKDGAPLCTAFLVEGPPVPHRVFQPQPSWVMSAEHCAEAGAALGVDVFSPKSPVTWVARNATKDVALGTVVWDAPVRLRPASEFSEVGEPVFIHGFGLAVENIVVGVVIPNHPDFPEYRVVLTITGPLWPGNSGSPVLNMRGEVVGLVSGVLCPNGRGSECPFVMVVPVTAFSLHKTPSAWSMITSDQSQP